MLNLGLRVRSEDKKKKKTMTKDDPYSFCEESFEGFGGTEQLERRKIDFECGAIK